MPVTVSREATQFPGAAYSPAAFSAGCLAGSDCSVEIPFALWDIDEVYAPDGGGAGTLYVRHGGFIEGVEQFDPRCFRIAPREAACMDPHQRKSLDVAYAAYYHGA
jgi:acyl transferase domain-containing protein